MKYKIYKLIENDNIVYVGITTLSLLKRLSTHKHKKEGISIHLIEETNNKLREIYWIGYYSNHYKLLNSNFIYESEDIIEYENIKISNRTKDLIEKLKLLFIYRDGYKRNSDEVLEKFLTESLDDIQSKIKKGGFQWRDALDQENKETEELQKTIDGNNIFENLYEGDFMLDGDGRIYLGDGVTVDRDGKIHCD